MESYIVYQARRYNVRGKQYLKTLEKYYVADIGLRYLLLGTSSTDVGYILENVVYLELLRRGYEVYVGKIDDLEVDFVCMNARGSVYISGGSDREGGKKHFEENYFHWKELRIITQKSY